MKTCKRFFTAALAVVFAFGLVGPTAALAAGPAGVDLGSAGNFAILAKTGISTTGATSVIGDLGISPAAASYITGFSLILPAAGAFSTSALVTGKIYAPGYADPTPANLTTAVLDMQNAYTDAVGRASTVTELGAGNIGGLTLVPGVYKWDTGVTVPTDVTLSGGANDIWIFQIAQTLTVSSGAHIILSGGAQAGNIFWAVAGQTTIGTTAVFNGNILDQTAIVLNTGAALNGRALAQTAVTLDASPVIVPAASATPADPETPVASPATPATPATSAVPTASPAVSATPVTSAVPATPAASILEKATNDAGIISTNNSTALLMNLGATANASKEQASLIKYKTILSQDSKIGATEKTTINDFIVYGTLSTLNLGAGERAGVINSYAQAFGKLPNSEAEWSDAIKIANSHWPTERSTVAETQAKVEFKKVYLRAPNSSSAYDNSAIMLMAYGLRPVQRNLNSERAAINSFRYAYKKIPASATDWDIVRAIAYSGSTR